MRYGSLTPMEHYTLEQAIDECQRLEILARKHPSLLDHPANYRSLAKRLRTLQTHLEAMLDIPPRD